MYWKTRRSTSTAKDNAGSTHRRMTSLTRSKCWSLMNKTIKLMIHSVSLKAHGPQTHSYASSTFSYENILQVLKDIKMVTINQFITPVNLEFTLVTRINTIWSAYTNQVLSRSKMGKGSKWQNSQTYVCMPLATINGSASPPIKIQNQKFYVYTLELTRLVMVLN